VSARHPQSAIRFLKAFRAGASAPAMDALLAEVRRDYQIHIDAQKVFALAIDVAEGDAMPADAADEVAALLHRARYLMEAV